MLALRRALFDSTWEQIIDGCKNYAKFCEEGGTTGSSFVQAPLRFIEDGSYLETFTFKAAEDPKIVEHRRKEADRLGRLEREGVQYGLKRYPLESVGAFETRIMLEKSGMGSRSSDCGHGGNSSLQTRTGDNGVASNIAARVSSLADRMRVAK